MKKRWLDHLNTIREDKQTPGRDLTDAEIQFIGLLIRSGENIPEREVAKQIWLEWLKKPEQSNHRKWNIERGYIDEDGNPLFD